MGREEYSAANAAGNTDADECAGLATWLTVDYAGQHAGFGCDAMMVLETARSCACAHSLVCLYDTEMEMGTDTAVLD